MFFFPDGNTGAVMKSCRPSLDCKAPLNVRFSYSFNTGFFQSGSELCCDSDRCNQQSQPVPSSVPVTTAPTSGQGTTTDISTGPVSNIATTTDLVTTTAPTTGLGSTIDTTTVPMTTTAPTTGLGTNTSSTTGPVTTTAPITGLVTTIDTTTVPMTTTAPTTGPVSVVLMPMWLTMMVKFTY
ncbi:salivary glue protein Sgs-3-like isoform X1 [Hypomesus transpacificus]|uniref:salivary glue protein Sgs-3-like isoform X1 n=2 Tax=Hypomesus transpacificus TaxID=137520 RepID=UPI001F0747B6|nr:salivary glue protein Sgs-3-like isoform X1 [Hypomesus transpacificus]